MKLIRVHYSDQSGEETVSIGALELHPGLIELLHELGVMELEGDRIAIGELRRAHKALRLRRALGVNLAGAAVILDLLERIENLEDEIRTLRRGR